MAHVVDIKSKNPLLGTWRSCDPFEDNVQYTITADNGKLCVTGIDTSDGEVPEISDVVWFEDKGLLQFSSHWPSTGRLTKYRLSTSVSKDRVQVSYSFTAQQIWEKL
jgi:hypothetical protein